MSGNWTVILAAAIHLSVTGAAMAQVEPITDPTELWEAVLKTRRDLTSIDVELEVHRDRSDGDPQGALSGSTLSYQIRLHADRRFLSVQEERPNNPEDAFDLLFSYCDGRYRLIPKVGGQAVHEFDDPSRILHRTRNHILSRIWINPQMIGIWPCSFQSLSELSLEQLAEFPQYLRASYVEPAVVDSKKVVNLVWEYEKNNARRRFVLDPAIGYLPLEISRTVDVAIGTVLTDSISSEWELLGDPDEFSKRYFPRRVTYRRTENERLLAQEDWRVRNWSKVNASDQLQCPGWDELDLWAGATIVHESPASGRRQVSEWDGKQEVAWSPSKRYPWEGVAPGIDEDGKSADRHGRMLVLAIVNVVTVLACLVYLVLRKKWR